MERAQSFTLIARILALRAEVDAGPEGAGFHSQRHLKVLPRGAGMALQVGFRQPLHAGMSVKLPNRPFKRVCSFHRERVIQAGKGHEEGRALGHSPLTGGVCHHSVQ